MWQDLLHIWKKKQADSYVYEVTLLYEMASKSSLICAGFWMSSSLEDRGWEDARASTANTLWTSLSTMRSFYYETNKTVWSKPHQLMSPLSYITLSIDFVRWERNPYHVPVGFSLICSQVLNIGCKAFIQPQVIPPPQGYQITKPLKTAQRKAVNNTANKHTWDGLMWLDQAALSLYFALYSLPHPHALSGTKI